MLSHIIYVILKEAKNYFFKDYMFLPLQQENELKSILGKDFNKEYI